MIREHGQYFRVWRGLCLRALQRQTAEVVPLRELNVFYDQKRVQVTRDLLDVLQGDVEYKGMPRIHDRNVGKEVAGRIEDTGLDRGLARFQRAHVIADHSLEPGKPIRTRDAQKAAVKSIQEAHAVPHGAILGNRIPVVGRNFPLT
jgi:hypothetical protein